MFHLSSRIRRFAATFIDHAEVVISAGKGGRGSVSFARAANKRVAPPDGGHGGNGGSVFIEASSGVRSLQGMPFMLKASNGMPGGGSQCNGKSGADRIVYVPVGTIITDKESGAVLADLSVHGARVAVASGGRGGVGNAAFVSGSSRSPKTSTDGQKGDQRSVIMDLRTLAQVGLVGLPNAGKSALLGALTKSKPKVAEYAFTTLQPWVGFLERSDYLDSITIADIPGLVEGANENRGLGHRFLRHIQRTECLMLVFDATDLSTLSETYKTLMKELQQFDSTLLRRRRILVANKMDLMSDKDCIKAENMLKQMDPNAPVQVVSAMTGTGIDALRINIEKVVSAAVKEVKIADEPHVRTGLEDENIS
ncbi:mitochondrial translation GTPase Obg/CgtA [Andalucia godoyi]|uniref:Mitochondrial translation GTPase Obg/CgtA n=1 Tax=Andalucia godoyi TaxID=505711 RepID=A0A8K0AIE2_ANDGO|nr:mitochondrial translation GTPase Obg/CgtA [Andalucia godoyi]|eukprot:ANDGO_02431.mRNA.1 mitochondrial translation GTPase Obg/CgtA